MRKHILEQSYKNIEIILADDCSLDGSWEKCQEMQAAYSNVKIIRNPVNMWQGEALKKAISIATGQWLLFMDVDDKIEQNCISKMLETAQTNHMDIVLANYKTVNEAGDLLSIFKPEISEGLYTPHDIAEKCWSKLVLTLFPVLAVSFTIWNL